MRRNERLLLIGIFCLALVVRVIFSWPAISGAEQFGMGDDDDYYRLGLSIAHTGTLADSGDITAYRMPLFPISIAPFYAVFGDVPHAPQLFIVLLSALTIFGVYALGRSLFEYRVGLLAAVLTSLNIQLVIYSRVLMSETLFIFLVLVGMLALDRTRVTLRWRWALTAGLVLGLATLTRANFGPFVAVGLGWLVYFQRAQFWRVVRQALVIGMLVGALWGMWVVRNYNTFGHFIPFTTQGGLVYYGIYNDVAASSTFPYFGYWLDISPIPPNATEPKLDEVARDRLAKDRAFAWIRAHPGLSLQMALAQAAYFWLPDIIDPVFVAMLPASLIGLALALRQRNPGAILWVLLAGVFTLMAIASVGVGRYQLPLYPIILVLAAASLIRFLRLVSARLGAALAVNNADKPA